MHNFWTIPTASSMYARLQNTTKYGSWQTWNNNIQSCGCRVAFVGVGVGVVWFYTHKYTSPFYFWTSGLSKYIKRQFISARCS